MNALKYFFLVMGEEKWGWGGSLQTCEVCVAAPMVHLLLSVSCLCPPVLGAHSFFLPFLVISIGAASASAAALLATGHAAGARPWCCCSLHVLSCLCNVLALIETHTKEGLVQQLHQPAAVIKRESTGI
jgi:hypothetical protein